MLNIILTSYNRPNLIQKTIASLRAQTCADWHCTILDDNSSEETQDAIFDAIAEDDHFTVIKHDTTPEQRKDTTRYSCLINEVLPTLSTGIVAYLCDNVEYHPDLVKDVLAFFERYPGFFGGYVLHLRDVWRRDGLDGTERIGTASQFGHWDQTPPELAVFSGDVHGWLDHSQVFHRLPVDIRWNEDPSVKTSGDGDFFTRLVAEYGPLYPIMPAEFRTLEHLLK